ncbi:AroM family protein [Alkalibacter mobilis]|uniref:AroM family protein n=1 Tax=Alkalibacter mobilis TaxID=2787712 RepID=UPI00189D6F27|nr:AroM family protein [Alkalibacter mobilis]MBF7097461.1 AroM family protein [Alkalibacter mobilis]
MTDSKKPKLGAITIGQSPRTDVVQEMLPFLGKDVEVIQAGALDGLEYQEILKFKPEEGDYVLVSTLRDGRSVKFAEKHILPRLQLCIDKLEDEGAQIILFICTGTFPDVFHSKKPVLYPQKIMHSSVPNLTSASKIGIVIPDKEQIAQTVLKWKEAGMDAVVVPFSPYTGEDEMEPIANVLKDADIDLIVMDCIGYTLSMKRQLTRLTEKSVVLARTFVARVLGELLDD